MKAGVSSWQEPATTQDGRDNGQIGIMIIGFVALALLLATVVIAISGVYLERKKLLSVADGASLAAADSFTLGALESAGGTPSAVLGSARVQSVVAQYLAMSPAAAGLEALEIASGTGSPEGSTAVVVLTATVRPPLVNFLVPDGIRIEARSTARAQLVR
ncbi:pilus assembly protein TadG-related protein [Pseudarthrobacter sp. PS3-L1]|uniref:pilus assembly protein TadG-related protein n=1 Tax=Pseudarthrobacter sp. PS3-L1 TaxID=3046207 RepID=UPI0024B98A8E|nr:pilus assembly protein TadG-related protein [Pseudarthrobacter sp. PS3-L1]MDJ0321519.1 pilus assembly protein TadG-related protein [Pseudarthrobacter sp. PS3-L1]